MRACPSAHRPPMSQSGNIKRAANLHLAPITVSCPSHRPISSHYRPMWIPGKFLRPNLFNPIVPIWPGSFSVSVIITINKNAQLIKQGCGDGYHCCFFLFFFKEIWYFGMDALVYIYICEVCWKAMKKCVQLVSSFGEAFLTKWNISTRKEGIENRMKNSNLWRHFSLRVIKPRGEI